MVFTSNRALLDGGAVGSRALDSDVSTSSNGSIRVVNDEISDITIKGGTSFVSNKCGANGGAMALVQSVAISFESENISFSRNSAGVSGGAVYVTGTGIGTVFRSVKFVKNTAQIGGGVYIAGSGTAVTIGNNNEEVSNPTTFIECWFVGNLAYATGGAVDSASGKDAFNRTLFKGNKARVGGALRLAGMASVDSCSFDGNVCELGGGPAVSNVGYISSVTNSYFHGNVFDCEPGMFLDFTEVEYLFETICNGCPATCNGCFFDETLGSPTCTSLSEAGVEHASSEGGTTTVEELQIHKGHWRAINTSTNVYKCFNAKACVGGLTGALDYCLPGYEGPFCSVCSKNYVSSLRFTCRECSGHMVDVIVPAVLAVLALAVGLAIISYLISTVIEDAERGIVDRVIQRVPTQSVKVVITVWQILTQFASVSNVTFPNVYQEFLDGVNFLNFDLSWVVSVGCFLEVDFHDRLLLTTITPAGLLGFLVITYAVAVRRNNGSSEIALRNTRNKHVSMALLITFLVYSSVSSVVFQMFAWDNLDDGKIYLRADYTIECDSPKHRALQIYAGFMILLYPVGIPVLYAGLLFRHRHVLRDEESREESRVVRSISNLWKSYKPQRLYYEVIECRRRILLAGVIVFIYPNSAAQIAVAFAIAVVFIFVSEGVAPYKSPWDAWISRMGHAIVFASMYLALLLKVNVSGEKDSSQKKFEVILVAAHGCMILTVVVETIFIALSLRAGKQKEDPKPRLRPSSNFEWTIQTMLVENDSQKVDL